MYVCIYTHIHVYTHTYTHIHYTHTHIYTNPILLPLAYKNSAEKSVYNLIEVPLYVMTHFFLIALKTLTFDSLIIMCLIVDMRGLSYLEFGELLVFLYPNFSFNFRKFWLIFPQLTSLSFYIYIYIYIYIYLYISLLNGTPFPSPLGFVNFYSYFFFFFLVILDNFK